MILEIKSLGTSVICEMPNKLFNIWHDNYFWKEYIPDVKIDICNKKPELKINIGKVFDWNKNSIITTSTENDLRSLIVIIGSMLEYKRQKKHLYQIHGSVATINNKAIAFIGGMSGIGKTTSAVNLSKCKNAKFIGDEKFIMDGKKHTVVSACPLSLDNNKTKLKKISNCDIVQIPIALIVFPVITTEEKLTVYKYDELKLFWHLYEEASRDIRNLNMLYDNFNKTCKSFDTNKIMSQRIKDIKNVAHNTPAYFLRGNTKQITNFIYNLIISST